MLRGLPGPGHVSPDNADWGLERGRASKCYTVTAVGETNINI